ncbi:hypothetical protein RJ641_007342 [Dillenia turbinata]|uniref:Uncharacterized protein n=1 Tax=Dillenia turbinata TaxID=194707 RepID=A0AAN8Z9P5_9MAGN
MLLLSSPSLISPFNFTHLNFRILFLGVESGEDLREEKKMGCWGCGEKRFRVRGGPRNGKRSSSKARPTTLIHFPERVLI